MTPMLYPDRIRPPLTPAQNAAIDEQCIKVRYADDVTPAQVATDKKD